MVIQLPEPNEPDAPSSAAKRGRIIVIDRCLTPRVIRHRQCIDTST